MSRLISDLSPETYVLKPDTLSSAPPIPVFTRDRESIFLGWHSWYLHPDGDDQASFDELELAGICVRADDGYLLVGWSTSLRQSTAAEVQEYREASRLRQKRYRDRQRNAGTQRSTSAADEPKAIRDVTSNATRDVTENVGSGSLTDPEKSAYVTRDVTRNADSPFCRNHPTGTR